MRQDNELKVAVLIPCYNEELTVGKVIRSFKKVLPDSEIYVYDNNSTDNTVLIAREAGVIVRHEELQGKGNVVRRMFRDIEADLYILVDGDDTYDASIVPEMVRIALAGSFDLVNGIRESTNEDKAYRLGHELGNTVLTGAVNMLFGDRIKDMLSGYKVLSKRFVKSFPALSTGFEIETELTVHALLLSMPIAHVKGKYKGRPEGSCSKLKTYSDGIKILKQIIVLFKQERPLLFFSIIGALQVLLAILLGIPLLATYFETGLVPRLPTAVLSMGIMLTGFLSFTCGLILDTVTRGRREARILNYLMIPSARSAVVELSKQVVNR
jgi:glycosyltransferase involved in cell wall biosynthesis